LRVFAANEEGLPMDAFEYSESDALYTQLSLFQKFVNNPHQI